MKSERTHSALAMMPPFILGKLIGNKASIHMKFEVATLQVWAHASIHAVIQRTEIDWATDYFDADAAVPFGLMPSSHMVANVIRVVYL